MFIEFSRANELLPPDARYTLYAATGTLDPLGGCQLRSTWCGLPTPLRFTVNVGFVDELLVMVSWPEAEPTADGANVRVKVIACPGFSVVGRLSDDIEKPLPVTPNEFTVTGAVPVELSLIVCVVELFTTTGPKAMLVAFTASVDVAAFSCRDTVLEVDPVDAVTVADCAVETEETFAVNVALVAAAATDTMLGRVTALLLLASPTLTPPLGADPDKVTVQ